MSVRTRVAEGKSVRVQPLAEELGVPANTLYRRALRGQLEAIRLGKVVMIPAHVAAPLLGIKAPETTAEAA